MAVEIVKSGDGWLIKCSDSGNRATGPARARGVGIKVTLRDIGDFITAIDKALNGSTYTFTRSDGVIIKAYPSEVKPNSIVIERSGGNWIRLDTDEALTLRLNLTRL